MFDPDGQKLWVEMDPRGVYSISYTYQLLHSDERTPLTHPLRTGDNTTVDDEDCFDIVNDLAKDDPLSAYHGRVLEVSFLIQTIKDDNGYKLEVKVHQGADLHNAQLLGTETRSDKVGTMGIKREKLKVRLIKG